MIKRIILALVLIVVIIEVLRETGRLSLDYYSSTINEKSNRDFHTDVMTLDLHEPMNNIDSGRRRFDEVPLTIIEAGDTLYNWHGKGAPLTIQVTTPDPATLWLPFYKTTAFDLDIAIDHDDGIGTNFSQSQLSMTGTMAITGDITVRGICSHRKARKMLQDKVAAIIADHIMVTLRDTKPVY